MNIYHIILVSLCMYVYDVHGGEIGKRKNMEKCMCGNNLK